jgi:hypothetical protein
MVGVSLAINYYPKMQAKEEDYHVSMRVRILSNPITMIYKFKVVTP